MPRVILQILFLSLATLATLEPAALAQGMLSSADHPRHGANTLTVDANTGLAWLDLPLTSGLSFQQVLAATQPGGAFAGFRFASTHELFGLFADAGLPGQGWHPISDPQTAPVLPLLSLLGTTSSQDGYPETFGVTGTPAGIGAHYAGGLDFALYNGTPCYFIPGPGPLHSLGSLGDFYGSGDWGSWLVMNVPEPSPATFGILLASILLGRRLLLPRMRPPPRPLR